MDIFNKFWMFYGLWALVFITFCPEFTNGCSNDSAKEPNETLTSKSEDIGVETKKDDQKRIFDKERYGKSHKFMRSISL